MRVAVEASVRAASVWIHRPVQSRESGWRYCGRALNDLHFHLVLPPQLVNAFLV